ncbi:MAG: SDR family oxidoreductase [Candidatus Omnitrophota bacterium]|nr:SDR family oxidoreductase [Candidatus Omnitrophota bacterium]
MDKKRTVFITGATGLLGSYLLKILLESGHKVYALARSRKDESAKKRVDDLLSFWNSSIPSVYSKNLIVIDGDITSRDFGLEQKNILDLLKSEIEIIFHCAALTAFKAQLQILEKINVIGTKNIFNFALGCKKIKKINHVSTAFVVGNKTGVNFNEGMLKLGQGFYNHYEWTKYEAETIVEDYKKKGLQITIFRPSLIIGESSDGKTNNFNFFYEPHRFFSQGLYEDFPMNLECSLNLINIDTAAKAILLLGDRDESVTYHIVSPEDTNNYFFAKLSSNYFNFKIPKFVPLEKFYFDKWTATQKMLAEPFIPYCNYKNKFISSYTQNTLKEYKFEYPKIDSNNLLKTFEYCDKVGFIKVKETKYA